MVRGRSLCKHMHLCTGGGSSGRRRLNRLVFSGEGSVGEWRKGEVADSVSRAGCKHLGFRLSPEDGVLRLIGGERRQVVGSCSLRGGLDLICGPLAHANGADFAGLDGTMKRFHCFFERSFVVVSMALIEIDIVGAEAIE